MEFWVASRDFFVKNILKSQNIYAESVTIIAGESNNYGRRKNIKH